MTKFREFEAAALPFLACIEAHFGGRVFVGTGTLIGPRLVLTAGHVVFNGSAPNEFRVTLGYPRRTITATDWRTTRPWMERDSKIRNVEVRALVSTDVGVVVLDNPIDTVVPTQKYQTTQSEVLEGSELNIAGFSIRHGGYPDKAIFAASRGLIIRRRDGRRIPHRITYPISTVAGMSGAPVWTNVDGDRTVRAIHTAKLRRFGTALRITTPVFQLIERWQTEFHPSSQPSENQQD